MRYLLLAAVAALTLSGCGGETKADESAATASQSPEDAYIAQVEETVPTYIVRKDPERFIDLGYSSCEAIGGGNLDDYEIATTIASTEGLELPYAEAIVWAGRQNLCPDL